MPVVRTEPGTRCLWLIAALAVGFGIGGCGAAPVGQVRLRWIPGSCRPIYSPGLGFYAYAPSVVQEDDADFLLVCRNREPYVIRDHIFGLRRHHDVVGEVALALAPAGQRAGWDSFHICDPSVVAGRFRAGESVYRYAMFYLGNDVDACENNQIGLALANSLNGPWIRHGRPIVADAQRGTWGKGQPSAISIDHAERILLFYTQGHGGSAGYVREVDLSDAANPSVGPEVRLSARGMTGTDGRPDWFNNFDAVFDRRHRRYVVVREQHPYPASEPSFIGSQLQIVSLAEHQLRQPDAAWTVEGEITPAATGFARNHNAAIARTAYGELPDSKRLRVFFASSKSEPELAGTFAAWSYELHEIAAEWVEPD